MRRFDLSFGNRFHDSLSEEQVEELYRAREVNRSTSCRRSGEAQWQTIDECLPILKYIRQEVVGACPSSSLVTVPSVAAGHHPRNPSHLLGGDLHRDDRHKAALTTSLKAGWICFGLGLAVAWFFPPAFFFYSVALIMAVVAMCTHQVNRGLLLLISTFVSMAASAIFFLMLAGGLFVAAVKPQVAEANRRMQQAQAQQDRLLREVDRSGEQLLKSLNQLGGSLPPTTTNVSPASSLAPLRSNPFGRRELLEEIQRTEAGQRQLHQQGRELDSVSQTRLRSLRALYDSTPR